ncbi:non-canonical purine NTP pyrophosphatase [Candidatus Gottesmanbacteria bacterium]|nr:non-canonical purine NTP pyrophosphatase [Candidatus Gottesmanbacteria bacterium]
MMKKLLIATTNPGKLAEISMFLSDSPIRLIGLKEAGITDRVEETGKTFEENAILKATFYAKKSGLPAIADDGGFEIDALGGEPGVKSHRWIHGDREDTDEELISYTIERLRGIPLPDRGAQLRAVVALALPDGTTHTSEDMIRGVIPLKPTSTRTPGFPFRSLLYLPQLGKFYNFDVLSTEENEAYNHRKKALEALKPIIRKYLI